MSLLITNKPLIAAIIASDLHRTGKTLQDCKPAQKSPTSQIWTPKLVQFIFVHCSLLLTAVAVCCFLLFDVLILYHLLRNYPTLGDSYPRSMANDHLSGIPHKTQNNTGWASIVGKREKGSSNWEHFKKETIHKKRQSKSLVKKKIWGMTW